MFKIISFMTVTFMKFSVLNVIFYGGGGGFAK